MEVWEFTYARTHTHANRLSLTTKDSLRLRCVSLLPRSDSSQSRLSVAKFASGITELRQVLGIAEFGHCCRELRRPGVHAGRSGGALCRAGLSCARLRLFWERIVTVTTLSIYVRTLGHAEIRRWRQGRSKGTHSGGCTCSAVSQHD